MNLEEILSQMVNGEKGYCFYRSFSAHPKAKAATKRCNEIITKAPELQGVVVALNLAPAFRWLLARARTLDHVMTRVYENNEYTGRLSKAQEMLVSVSGEQPHLFFKQREQYYTDCARLLSLLEAEIKHLQGYPGKGQVYFDILDSLFLHDRDGKDVSVYLLNQNIQSAIDLLYEDAGEAIDTILDRILDEHSASSAELAYLYHNIDVLIREYSRIVWDAGRSNDKAVQLLDCKTEAEMLAITKKDKKYEQAYLIAEYVKFIKSAVALVREFPGGEEYFPALAATFRYKPQNVCDKEIAETLGISQYTYATRKKRAYAIFGAILWGHTGNAFLNILTEQ